jgi:hypothetical protein
MAFDELPAELWPLADAAQEVLLDRQPSVRLLAPVPLRQLDTDSMVAAEPYLPRRV